jgi:hypothetical protein
MDVLDEVAADVPDVNVPDPIEGAQRRLEAMRTGDGRDRGFGVIKGMPVDVRFGWLPAWQVAGPTSSGQREELVPRLPVLR